MISYSFRRFDENSMGLSAKGWNWKETLDIDRLSNCILKFPWCPIEYNNGHRKEDNFIKVQLLALDFEHKNFTLDDALDKFHEFRHIIGTTRNHQKEKGGQKIDRFRVILFYSEPIYNLDLYKFNYKQALKAFPGDEQCKDGARVFLPCTKIISKKEGGWVGIEALPKKPAKKKDPYAHYYRAGMPTPYLQRLFSCPPSEGSRNITAYKAFREFCKIGTDISKAIELVTEYFYGSGLDEKTIREIYTTAQSAYKKGS